MTLAFLLNRRVVLILTGGLCSFLFQMYINRKLYLFSLVFVNHLAITFNN